MPMYEIFGYLIEPLFIWLFVLAPSHKRCVCHLPVNFSPWALIWRIIIYGNSDMPYEGARNFFFSSLILPLALCKHVSSSFLSYANLNSFITLLSSTFTTGVLGCFYLQYSFSLSPLFLHLLSSSRDYFALILELFWKYHRGWSFRNKLSIVLASSPPISLSILGICFTLYSLGTQLYI